MGGTIGNFKYSMCGFNRWQVKRGDFVMAMFGSCGEARTYAQKKHDDEGGR
jgi:hypothetical protein